VCHLRPPLYCGREAGASLVSARYLVIVLPRLLSVVSWFIAAAAPRQRRCCRRAERGAHLSFCFLTVAAAAAGEWDSVRYFSIGGGSGRWAELTAPLASLFGPMAVLTLAQAR